MVKRQPRRRRGLGSLTAARGSLPTRSNEREKDNVRAASTIRARDEEISLLRRELMNNEQTLMKVRSELNGVRTLYKEQIQWHLLSAEALKRENDAMKEQIRELNEGLNAESLIKEYADAIRKAAPSKLNASYVSNLQSQLCKAMHKVEVLSTQLNTVRKDHEELVDALRDEMTQIVDDKCRTEAEMMNRLNALSHEKNSIEDQYKEKLKHRDETIEQLESKLDELRTEAHEVACGGRGIWSSSEVSSEDMAMTLEVLKDHLDVVAQQKESAEKELKAKDDTIALLREINEANDKIIAQLTSNSDTRRSEHRQDVEGSKESEKSLNTNNNRLDKDEQRPDEEGPSDEDEEEGPTEDDFLELMNTIGAMTKKIEDDVMSSLVKRKEVIAS